MVFKAPHPRHPERSRGISWLIISLSFILSSCATTTDNPPICAPTSLEEFSQQLTAAAGGDVVFFASWCPFCKETLSSSNKDSIFVVFYDNKERASQALRSIPSFNRQSCVHDFSGKIAATLKVESVPFQIPKKEALTLLQKKL